jgi:hypothetical protein
MSGGHFDYKQYWINDIADSIERELNRQGKEKPKDELYCGRYYYDEYTEEKFYPTYSDAVQEKMREAVKQLRLAAIYAQRIDWFLSGDDSEESFIERLDEELNEINGL